MEVSLACWKQTYYVVHRYFYFIKSALYYYYSPHLSQVRGFLIFSYPSSYLVLPTLLLVCYVDKSTSKFLSVTSSNITLTIWAGQHYFSFLSFSQNFFTFQFLKNQYSTTFSQNICSPFLIPLNHIQAQRMCSPASKNCQALDKCYISTYQTKVELSREVSG